MNIQLRYPLLGNYDITQGFGENYDWYNDESQHPGWKTPGHNGLDFGAPMVSAIVCAFDGRIKNVAMDSKGFGIHIDITTEFGWMVYAHLNNSIVQAGQLVRAGNIIGYTDNTGCSTGPHLHFGVYIKGLENNGFNGAIDPRPMIVFPDTDEPAPDPLEDETVVEVTGLARISSGATGLNVRNAPDKIKGDVIGYLPDGIVVKYYRKCMVDTDIWLGLDQGIWIAARYDEYQLVDFIE